VNLPHCTAGVRITCTHVSMAGLPDGDAPPSEWAALLGLTEQQQQQQQEQEQMQEQQQGPGQEQSATQQAKQEQQQKKLSATPQAASSGDGSHDQTGNDPPDFHSKTQQDAAPAPSGNQQGSTSLVLLADPSFLKIQVCLRAWLCRNTLQPAFATGGF